ncbi:hypothetical protein A3850_010830 [Lewinella sp. 4G2]|nr:hypothetical protein A3850_010830 [Lewinella sp. 4G2]
MLFLLLSFSLHAQEADVFGQVIDEEGTPLVGATVRVLGSVIGTTTDYEGHYDLGIPPGRIRMVFTYLGYRDLDTVVVAKNADREIELNVVMEQSSINAGPEVIVIGSRASRQAQALRRQQSALTAQTIIHSELFNKYPDVTIAETVSRLPGVSIIRGVGEGKILQVRGLPEQFTAVALNGQRLPTVQAEADQEGTLDLIQSNLVDEVRVIKARTADMDGDAIGGTVDFRVRQPEEKFETLVQAGVGNNFGFDDNPGQQTGATEVTGVINSEINDEKIYALAAGSYQRLGRGTQQTIYDYEGSNQDLFAARPADIDRLVERRGFVGAIEFRPSIYNRLKIAYNLARTEEEITNRQLFARNLDGGVGTLDRRTSTWDKERQLELVALEGENNFPRTRVDYTLSFSQTRENLDDRLSSFYGSATTDARFPALGNKELTDARARSSFSGAALGGNRNVQENIDLDEDVAIMSANVTRYLNKSRTSYLRGGFRYRSKNRTYGVFGAQSEIDRALSAPAAGEFRDPVGAPLFEDVPNLNDEVNRRYAARQRINAGYLLYAANLSSRFSISAGGRYESLEVQTTEVDQDTFSFTEGDFLPSINLTYRARRERQVRLSVYQAVARANYGTYISGRRLPLMSLDEFSVGNQDIQNTFSNNIDLTFERYGRRDGLVSAGLYYKQLNRPTLRSTVTNYDTEIPTYTTQLINTDDASIFGLELAIYQNLNFLSPGSSWRHFNLNATYNFNAIVADDDELDIEDFSLGQAPRQTANLSFVYANPKRRINLVAAANYRDRVFDRLLDNRAIYKNGFFSLDISADYRVYKDFSLYVRLNNLTDHPFREHFGLPGNSDSRLRSEARYGTWGVVGVRLQPKRNRVRAGESNGLNNE